MPSNRSPTDRVRLALDAVADQVAAYRAVIINAHARACTLLAAGSDTARAAAELGAFAQRRIDPDRFAALNTATMALDAASRTRIARAASVLRELAEIDDRAFVVDVAAGSGLRDAVANALAHLGRAFGATVAVGLLRAGRYVPAEHDGFLGAYPFELWTKADRAVAPPLVLRVNGTDLHASALADVLDGAVHLALVVEGACAPAALVRLITPRTLVLQTSNDTGLDRFAKYSGPAIAALASDSTAGFLHDPSAGKLPWQRIHVWNRAASPRKRLGGWSTAQQQDELDQLDLLAQQPSLGTTAIEALAPAGEGDPVDRLASWLLAASGAEQA